MKAIDPPIVVSAVYPCSTEKLWSAITKLDEMKKWYFDNIPEFEAIKGFKTKFAVSSDTRTFTHNWEVTNVNNGKRIQYTWTFDEYPGESYSRFEILPINESKTQLTLTCIVTSNFPNEITEFKRESCIGGWEYLLNDRLKTYFQNES